MLSPSSLGLQSGVAEHSPMSLPSDNSAIWATSPRHRAGSGAPMFGNFRRFMPWALPFFSPLLYLVPESSNHQAVRNWRRHGLHLALPHTWLCSKPKGYRHGVFPQPSSTLTGNSWDECASQLGKSAFCFLDWKPDLFGNRVAKPRCLFQEALQLLVYWPKPSWAWLGTAWEKMQSCFKGLSLAFMQSELVLPPPWRH